jgi:predicted O-methyltransferase YrrM
VSAPKPMQPLVRLGGPGPEFEISKAGLAVWCSSEAYERTVAFYGNYPQQSLISDESRALLHHLVMTRRPERVLEIGTFVAGTTEVFARALWEAGQGHIDTIDPFGAERCPPIIAAFPNELRDRITFSAVNSATHFDHALSHNRSYDLVFIDGNHELEYALFDIMCTARLISPRGLVVLDNVDQPGPRLATKLFLEQFPEWNDVTGVVTEVDPDAPFAAPIPSFPNTNFYLLEAPPHYVVRDKPRSFGSLDVDRAEVDGIELELAAPARGNLHIHVYARTFGLPEPEELQSRRTIALDYPETPADGPVRVPLHKALRTAFPQPGLLRRVEILLAFTGGSQLALRSPPWPYPARLASST